MTGPDDPRLSFGRAAEIYDQIRPTYPPALYDDLFDEIETFINDEFGGVATRPLVTTLTVACLRT